MSRYKLTHEQKAQIAEGVAMLRREERALRPFSGDISVSHGEYSSLDSMMELLRAKLAHYEKFELWGVDSTSPIDGVTICLTGNGPKGEDHAHWIALLWQNASWMLRTMDELLEAARVEDEEDK